MNNRQRKKWLKKNKKYVDSKECWNLDYKIAEFVLPRLKRFRQDTNSYPGHGELDTFEKWMEALDKMILAFEYIIEDDNWWLGNADYDSSDGLYMDLKKSEEIKKRQVIINEGLQLFGKYFQNLWW